MKWGSRFLSFGVIVVILFTLGCGSVTSPSPASLATTTSTPGNSGSGTTTSSGGVFTFGYFPTLGIFASTIYVIQEDTSANYSVLEFSTSAPASSSTPAATVNAPANTSFYGLAVDGQGYLYVSAANLTAPTTFEILVYAPGAVGAAAPVRTLNSPTLGDAIAVDSTGQIYTYGGLCISVYAAGATGNAAPLRTITGDQTQLASGGSIAIDTKGDIYVAGTNATKILVFSLGANGNVAPMSVIEGAATGIVGAYGLSVDGGGDVFVKTSASGSDVLKFAAGANGNISPMTTFELGSPTTNLAVDGAGDLYTITNLPTQPEVVYSSQSILAAGLSPVTFTSGAWTNSPTGQIAVH